MSLAWFPQRLPHPASVTIPLANILGGVGADSPHGVRRDFWCEARGVWGVSPRGARETRADTFDEPQYSQLFSFRSGHGRARTKTDWHQG